MHFSQVRRMCVRLQEVSCATLPCSHSYATYPQNRRPIRGHLFVQNSSASRGEASVDHPHPLGVFQEVEKTAHVGDKHMFNV